MGINLGSAYGEILIGTGGAEQSVQSLSDRLRSVGTTMSLAISAPLIAVGTAALVSASGFEQSMNVMAQVSGATGAQMDNLRAQALQLGAETSFSAGEAAEAMLELAKAGMTAEQTGAAIAGVMDLAAAGGIGLADAATITANAINSFGLEAGAAAGVANTFAAAANASSADVNDLARGFQMAGAVFASNGQSVDDLAASLAILSNNGIAGSDAGTSLKTMLMRLAAPTDEAAAVIQKLGLQVYDATGAMLPFGDIVGGLETATAGMSDAQRNAALSTLFGADAIRAATILAGEGKSSYDKMTGALQAQGAAADVAGARMQGFRGAIEYIKGSIDSFLIGTALPFLDSMSGIVRQVADAITSFGGLPQPVKDAALAFAGVLAAAGPLMLAISGVAAVVGALTSPIGLLVLAVAGLAAAWAVNWGGIREKTAAAWAAVQPTLTTIKTWLETNLPTALTTLQAGFAKAWTAVSSAVSSAWTAMQTTFTTIKTWLETNLPGAVTTLQNGFAEAWPAVSTAVSTAWTGMQTTFSAIKTWLETNLPTAVAAVQTGFETAWPAVSAAVSTALTAMEPGFTSIKTWLETNLPTAAATLQTGFTTVWNALPGVVTTAQEGMATAFTAIQTAWQTLEKIFGPAIDRIRESFSGLSTQVDPVKTSLSGLLTAFQNLWTALQPILTALGKVIGAVFGVAALVVLNAFSAAIEALGPVVTTMVDQITLVINTIADILTNATALVKAVIDGDWTAAWASAQAIGENVVTFLQETWENFSTVIETILQAIYDTVVNTLTDMGVDAEGVVNGIKTWWEEKWNAMKGFVQPVLDIIDSLQTKLQGFVDWIGSISIPNPFSGWSVPDIPEWARRLLPGAAVGSSFLAGGLTEVGERGREFIIPPAGSKVLTNGQSNRLAAAGADWGGGSTINMGQVYVGDKMDVEAIAYRVATIIERRRR